MSSNETKPVLALFPSYIAAVENSVGTNLFRNLYYNIDGKVIDVLDDGDLSCAVFVSTVLYLFELITERHTTVKGTIEDLEAFGWYKISEPKKGAVIHWDFRKNEDGTMGTNQHLGFYINEQTAVSNSSEQRVVMKHNPHVAATHDGRSPRDILAYYWHPMLDAS